MNVGSRGDSFEGRVGRSEAEVPVVGAELGEAGLGNSRNSVSVISSNLMRDEAKILE